VVTYIEIFRPKFCTHFLLPLVCYTFRLSPLVCMYVCMHVCMYVCVQLSARRLVGSWYRPNIHTNIIFLFRPWSSALSLTFRFSDRHFECISSLPLVLHTPPISFSLIWWPHNIYAVFSILVPLPLSNTLYLCSSLGARSKVSRPYKTGKIIVLYILIRKFLHRRREDKRFWTEWQ
jgi:hypothetical protein